MFIYLQGFAFGKVKGCFSFFCCFRRLHINNGSGLMDCANKTILLSDDQCMVADDSCIYR